VFHEETGGFVASGVKKEIGKGYQRGKHPEIKIFNLPVDRR